MARKASAARGGQGGAHPAEPIRIGEQLVDEPRHPKAHGRARRARRAPTTTARPSAIGRRSGQNASSLVQRAVGLGRHDDGAALARRRLGAGPPSRRSDRRGGRRVALRRLLGHRPISSSCRRPGIPAPGRGGYGEAPARLRPLAGESAGSGSRPPSPLPLSMPLKAPGIEDGLKDRPGSSPGKTAISRLAVIDLAAGALAGHRRADDRRAASRGPA